MSHQGTWCGSLIIEAVAEEMNLTINITESKEDFAAFNVISPINTGINCTTINIGHVDEVSTAILDQYNWSTSIDVSEAPRDNNSNDHTMINIDYVDEVHYVSTVLLGHNNLSTSIDVS
jgi:hypothetical protein